MPQTDVSKLKQSFGAASMNDHTHVHLWVEGAAQFIPRLNDLLSHQDNKFDIVPVEKFSNPDQDVLGRILMNYSSDKSTTHNYNILYSHILKHLGPGNKLNVLEIGMGTNNPNIVSSMGSDGRPGASLFSFREYLPNAHIYGADVDRDILFQDTRISTSYVDQMNMSTFKDMAAKFGNVKYDLIIDDGLHSIGANINTLLFALDHVADDGWIAIEDIGTPTVSSWTAIDFILKNDKRYDSFMVKCGNGYHYQNESHVFVVHKLKSS